MQLDRPAPTFFGVLPKGPSGTKATLQIMQSLVRRYRKHPLIRQTAMDAVGDLAGKDWPGEAKRLHAYVRDRVRYLRDTRGVETVQTPDVTLDLGQGDCDDKAVLLASLLESIGHPTRFVAIGYEPNRFSHVYVETLVGRFWLPLETTEPVPAGWKPRPPRVMMRVHN